MDINLKPTFKFSIISSGLFWGANGFLCSRISESPENATLYILIVLGLLLGCVLKDAILVQFTRKYHTSSSKFARNCLIADICFMGGNLILSLFR